MRGTHSSGLSAGRLFDRIVLRGGQADGLAAVLADATPVVLAPIGCPPAVPRVTRTVNATLSYPAGREVTATIHASTCNDQGNVLAGDHDYRLPFPVAQALLSDADGEQGNTGPVTPDLIGMNLAAAGAIASQRGLAVGLAGAMADPRVPLGTVIAQALPPGLAARKGAFPQVMLIVAVRPAPKCTARQLHVTYRGNGAQRGRDFGALVFRDVGAAPCTLPGPARVAGLSRSARSSLQRPPGVGDRNVLRPAIAAQLLGRYPGDRDLVTLDGMSSDAQGWYRDPFEVHQDRYFSAGHPTKLVRDDGQEAYDPPPERPQPAVDLVPADAVADGDDIGDASDLHRADEVAVSKRDGIPAARGVLDIFDRTAGQW